MINIFAKALPKLNKSINIMKNIDYNFIVKLNYCLNFMPPEKIKQLLSSKTAKGIRGSALQEKKQKVGFFKKVVVVESVKIDIIDSEEIVVRHFVLEEGVKKYNVYLLREFVCASKCGVEHTPYFATWEKAAEFIGYFGESKGQNISVCKYVFDGARLVSEKNCNVYLQSSQR